MIRGTTPFYTLALSGVDLTGKTVYVTISQHGRKLTKTGGDLSVAADAEGSTIAFALTQEETLDLEVGSVEVQVRFIDAAGIARATEICSVAVGRVLKEGVIEYADDPA